MGYSRPRIRHRAGVIRPAQSRAQRLSRWRLASSFGTGSNVFTGVSNSNSFVAIKRFMHVRLTSTPDKTRRREHGALRFTLQIAGRPAYLNAAKEGVFEWQTAGLERQMDLPAYFVIADRAPDGYIAVEKIIFSDQRQAPRFDIAPTRVSSRSSISRRPVNRNTVDSRCPLPAEAGIHRW
jgi:hypothetical protein